MRNLRALFIVLVFSQFPLYANRIAAPLTESETQEIAVEAYLYFYPLVSMEVTRKIFTNAPSGIRPGVGPENEFHHMRAFPTADFRDVVRPNFDTLYSSAWLDLKKEPVIISVPDTEGRYYLLPMLDMWSNVFASPGKRTTGTAKAEFAVVPMGWRGRLPSGVQRIDAPGSQVWVIGRTQTNGPEDYQAVHKVQDSFKITPLSSWGKTVKPRKTAVDPSVDMKTPPLDQVNSMPASQYFTLALNVMKSNPAQIVDWSQIARFKRIGIEPGKAFSFEKLSAGTQKALQSGIAVAQKRMKEKVASLARIANGWQMNTDTMGVYGIFYLKRAIVAMVGLGANQPEDAIYPLCVADNEGNPLVGKREYILHFEKDELPPVEAFWSVTMYDEEGFQVANKLNRFAIGDRDKLKYNSDGSLDLHLQSTTPGADKESNWLPAPATGKLGVTMRLYAPKPAAIDGRWNPPAIRRN